MVSARSPWALGKTGGSDWNDDPLDEGRAALAGQYLCSPREPFKAFIYAVLGDLEFFASHLGMPYPGDDHFCWLCTCDKLGNPFNNFQEACVFWPNALFPPHCS